MGIAKKQLDVFFKGGTNKTIQIQVFQYENRDLVYLRVPVTYIIDPFLGSLGNFSVLDSAFQFWKKGLPSADISIRSITRMRV